MKKGIYSKAHKKIVEKLKQARKEAGLDQQEVARQLGKTQSYVSKLESGQRKLDILQIKELAEIYHKKITDFIED